MIPARRASQKCLEDGGAGWGAMELRRFWALQFDSDLFACPACDNHELIICGEGYRQQQQQQHQQQQQQPQQQREGPIH